MDIEQVTNLFNEGLSDYKIAKILNSTHNKIYYLRKKHGLHRNTDLRYNISKPVTKFQREVLIGTILGDSSFKKGKDCKNVAVQCAHGVKQKEYCEYKTSVFYIIRCSL